MSWSSYRTEFGLAERSASEKSHLSARSATSGSVRVVTALARNGTTRKLWRGRGRWYTIVRGGIERWSGTHRRRLILPLSVRHWLSYSPLSGLSGFQQQRAFRVHRPRIHCDSLDFRLASDLARLYFLDDGTVHLQDVHIDTAKRQGRLLVIWDNSTRIGC